jgi:hypothetical protein
VHQASARLRVSTSSRNFLSSAACASASLTMRLISSSDRPLEALIVIFCSLPVALSLAETCRMPLASMSNVDLDLRHAARRRRDARSDRTCRATCCPGAARARPAARGSSPPSDCHRRSRRSGALVGIVVFFSISLVITPPSVSMPSDSGVTSSSSTSLTSPAARRPGPRRRPPRPRPD